MTEKIGVFLRGINVGGIQIKMDALKAAFGDMGFRDVQTLLASGNVVAAPPTNIPGRDALQALIERGLSDRFNYEAHVILRSRHELDPIIATAQALTVPPDTQVYVLLCADANLPGELQALFASLAHTPNEGLWALEQEAIWTVLKGSTLESVFGSKVLGDKKYKARLTSRNLNTMEKVQKLLPP